MKKSLQITKHTNLVDEAIIILYQWANNDALEQMKEEYRSNYADTPDRYNQSWDKILKIYEAVKGALKPKKDRVDYYFYSPNHSFFFNAAFAFLWEYEKSDNKLLTYEERFRDLKEEDRIKAYAQLININGEDSVFVEGLHTYEDFLKYLDEAACHKDMKWDVLQIFHNQKKYFDEVAAILKEVTELLEKEFSEQIAELEQQFYDYWIRIQEKDDIIELLQQKLKVTWDKNINILLMPMIFYPFNVSLSYQADEKVINVLRLGILLDQRFNTDRRKMESEDIVNFGKLLCDKSKVDILEMTAKRPCYGKEIALELGLTTATISYHVSALMKLGLLKTEVNSNRVYYCMNKEKLSEYLEDIRAFYLGI